jgi:hopene-associated glycosyltransferase HpnB
MNVSNTVSDLVGLSLLIWLYLLFGRHGFWRARPRLEFERPSVPNAWPDVVAVVPARNEAETVRTTLRSLLGQHYGGTLTVILVDDHSEDSTRAIAERLAVGAPRPLEVIAAPALPPGWSGKLWAVASGLRHAEELAPAAPYFLLTDADIAHAPDNLTRLIAKAEAERLDLTSLMVRLCCMSFWERLLIPPFVFFFQKLYPFPAANTPASRVAAAAGGCMLVRRQALHDAGGIEAIHSELIDDVALARAIKRRPGGGRIWLGLGGSTRSLRRYKGLGDAWEMVARTADTQLRHSLLLLIRTLMGMLIAYLTPVLALIMGLAAHDLWLIGRGGLALAAMAVAFLPTLRLYDLGGGRSLTLPVAALLFAAMTVDSAVQHRRGTGGRWKGRVLAPETQARSRAEASLRLPQSPG